MRREGCVGWKIALEGTCGGEGRVRSCWKDIEGDDVSTRNIQEELYSRGIRGDWTTHLQSIEIEHMYPPRKVHRDEPLAVRTDGRAHNLGVHFPLGVLRTLAFLLVFLV